MNKAEKMKLKVGGDYYHADREIEGADMSKDRKKKVKEFMSGEKEISVDLEIDKDVPKALQAAINKCVESIKACAHSMEKIMPIEEKEGVEECPNCNGEGEVDLSIGPSRIVECEKCNGTGETHE